MGLVFKISLSTMWTVLVMWAIAIGIALTFAIGIFVMPWVGKVQAQSTPTVVVSNGLVAEGDTVFLDIFLSEAPEGLAGFNVDVWIPGFSTFATVVGGVVDSSFPLVNVLLEAETPSLEASVNLMGVDLDRTYERGAINIPLATVEIIGVSRGCVDILVSIFRLDNDSGNAIEALESDGILEIIGILPVLSNQVTSVRDIDCDGIAEDLNGNGRFDFQDIVLLFTHLDSVEVRNNVSLFDWNSNGTMDFDDVVLAFNSLIS